MDNPLGSPLLQLRLDLALHPRRHALLSTEDVAAGDLILVADSQLPVTDESDAPSVITSGLLLTPTMAPPASASGSLAATPVNSALSMFAAMAFDAIVVAVA